jgi:hypothetical protein
MASRIKLLWPALITFTVTGLYIGYRLAAADFDPAGVAEIGSRYSELEPSGDPGYDGQFFYYIALDPNPESVAPHLDVPAYRFQRILYPLAVRLFSLGNPVWIPWGLILFNLLFHTAATWGMSRYFSNLNLWIGYSLTYGLWVGLVAAAGLDMSEPLAYGLVVFAWLAWQKGSNRLGSALIVLSIFAKELCLVFWAAALVAEFFGERDRGNTLILLSGGLLFIAWQAWLWGQFGSIGIGSGGALATAFEWIPLMGLLRIGTESMVVLGVFLLILLPTIIIPTVWGLIVSTRSILRGMRQVESWALALNSLLILFLPFSTFREPLGLVRVATGLVLSVLVYSGARYLKRPLNYSLFWTALLVLIVPR